MLKDEYANKNICELYLQRMLYNTDTGARSLLK